MAVGCKVVPHYSILPEQILGFFGVDIDDTNKCTCPFHNDTQPSMQVNKDYVYCYGCGWAGDAWKLAEGLLEQRCMDIPVRQFLITTAFPSPSGRTYKTASGYSGPVEKNLIDYWHNCLMNTPNAIERLQKERLLTLETMIRFKLGWRPDKRAFVIPYLYRGQAEIVQFRSTSSNEAGSKYWGLEGHNRGSIINQDILDSKQEYVVHLMGAFDPILANQDGLLATGMNGSMPFKRTEKERVQQMFAKQDIVFVVPDNNPSEIKEAHKFAKWIGAEVRTFSELTPHNTDYISYRRDLGKTVEDFKREVLGILPYDDLSEHQLFPNLCSLYDAGNKHEFASVYCEMLARGVSWSDMAITLANKHVVDAVSRKQLYNVKDKESFISAMGYQYTRQGGW